MTAFRSFPMSERLGARPISWLETVANGDGRMRNSVWHATWAQCCSAGLPGVSEMKLIRDKIPEVIYSNGEIACVHIADDREYSRLLRQKLQEEVEEYLESGATEELADILEVLYALAAVLGVSEASLEQLRLAKADARGRFLRRIVWHGSRPRLAPPSKPVAAIPVEPPVAQPTTSVEPMHDMSLFDLSQLVQSIRPTRDSGHHRLRTRQSATTHSSDEADNGSKQLQLSLEVSTQ